MDNDKTTKSLVIPTYTVSDYLEGLALKCIESHRGKVDEIIVTEDGGKFSKKLKEAADIYIYGKENVGFTKNVNRGWRQATKGFTFIVNSDTRLVSGNLRDLCDPDHVTSPQIDKGGFGSYFVVPAWMQNFGMLDERMRLYYSDVDYFERIKKFYRKEDRVVVSHQKASSTKRADKEIISGQQIIDMNTYDKIVKEEHPERRTDI